MTCATILWSVTTTFISNKDKLTKIFHKFE